MITPGTKLLIVLDGLDGGTVTVSDVDNHLVELSPFALFSCLEGLMEYLDEAIATNVPSICKMTWAALDEDEDHTQH